MKFNENLINSATPIFPINVAAQYLKVPTRALKIYDEEKILCTKKSSKNKKLYSFDDLKKAEFIKYLTQTLGLNLAGVKIILVLLKKLEISSGNHRTIINEMIENRD